MSYQKAGVDIEAGNELVRRLKAICPAIGGFGGLYPLGNDYLVAGTDGVGTKLKIAFEQNRHDTIGIDLVAMCVNDIITSGATPLFFLDYFATSKLNVDQAELVLKGIVAGCEEAGCALLGGETAEMPGMYQEGEYDLSGFAVGKVAKEDLVDGTKIESGDFLVAIPSSGLHSNGFSLVRKVMGNLQDPELLIPTRIYVKKILEILDRFSVKGMAHITGGGLTENIPRMIPKGLGVEIEQWEIPEIFQRVEKKGNIDAAEMRRTFNLGVGMVLAMDPHQAQQLCKKDSECWILGQVINKEGVIYR